MQICVKTNARTQMLDITAQVRQVVEESKIQNGLVHVCSMHTTGAITINENADPAVEIDIFRIYSRGDQYRISITTSVDCRLDI